MNSLCANNTNFRFAHTNFVHMDASVRMEITASNIVSGVTKNNCTLLCIYTHTHSSRAYIDIFHFPCETSKTRILWPKKIYRNFRMKFAFLMPFVCIVIAAIINFLLSFQCFSSPSQPSSASVVSRRVAVTLLLTLQTNLNCAEIYGVNKNCLLFQSHCWSRFPSTFH